MVSLFYLLNYRVLTSSVLPLVGTSNGASQLNTWITFSHSLSCHSHPHWLAVTPLGTVRISAQILLIMSHPDNLRLVHGLHCLCVQARTLAARTARIVFTATAAHIATVLLVLVRVLAHAATVVQIPTTLLVVIVNAAILRLNTHAAAAAVRRVVMVQMLLLLFG